MKDETNATLCGILKVCRFGSTKSEHPGQVSNILLESTGGEMAEYQQRPQYLMGDCGCPTDMAVLSRCPANNDDYSVAGDDGSVGDDQCPMGDDRCPVADDG
jgi:hypothetical protein